MQLFVGLGNPGAQYAVNRHNIGFMALDRIAQAHDFSPWRSKFDALTAEGLLDGRKVMLIKPQTFMNLSGQSVGAAIRFFKLCASNVTVFHDELDLAPGKLRCKQGGGHAGHNGLRSLHQHIGPDYARVRLGIGHPGDRRLVSTYVLNDFSRTDRDWLDPLLDAIASAAPRLAAGDAAGFANDVAARIAPPQRKSAPGPKRARDPAPGRPGKGASATGAATPPSADTRSALQKLMDRFR